MRTPENHSQEFAEQLDRVSSEIERVRRHAPTALEVAASAAAHLGSVGGGAFDAYADAMDRSISVQSLLSQQTGRAMQNVVASTLRGIGSEAAANAVMETAKGIAASTGPAGVAAFGNPGGHFAAAGMFASVAALAGVGSGALSVKPGGGGGGGGGGSSRDGRSSEASDSPMVNVTVIGAPDWDGKRELAKWVAEVAASGGG